MRTFFFTILFLPLPLLSLSVERKENFSRYNEGTRLLQQGDWEQALLVWSQPQLFASHFPPLVYRLQINRAIAKMQEAMQESNQLDAEEAFYSLTLAQEAWCVWIEAIGAERCSWPIPLHNMLSAAQKTQVLVAQKQREREIARLSFAAKSALLEKALQQHPVLDGERYAAYWLAFWEQTLPLWEMAVQETENRFFLESYQRFLAFLGSLRQGDFSRGEEQLREIREQMGILREKEWKGVDFALWELEQDYQQVRVGRPLQRKAVAALLERVVEVEKEQPEPIRELLSRSRAALQKAEEALEQEEEKKGRLYFLIALLWQQHALRTTDLSVETAPKTLLQYALQDQELLHAMSFYDDGEEVFPLQKMVRDEAALFPAAVFAYQSEQGSVCQQRRWQMVYAWYLEGWREVTRVLTLLETRASGEWIRERQKNGIRAWRQALQALEEEPPEEEFSSLDVLFQRIQQMHAQDRGIVEEKPLPQLPTRRAW